MKKKLTGGPKFHYQKRNEFLRKLSMFCLFAFGLVLFGALFDDVTIGASLAAVFGFVIPDGITDAAEIKKLEDAYIEKNGGAAGLAIKEMVSKFNEKQSELSKLISEKADESKITTLKSSMDSLKDELLLKVASFNDAQVQQGLAIKELQEQAKKGNKNKSVTLYDALLEAFQAKKADIDKILKGNQTESLKVKVAVVMGDDTTIGAGSTQISLTQNTGIISIIRKRELTYRQAVSVGGISTNIAMWIEETDEQGAPIFIGEGDAKTQLSVLYVERTESVKKIAVYGKVTTELMADLPQLVSYIQNNIMRRLDIKVEDKLFNATGAGDDPKGMINYATQFTGGALAGQVLAPNELDVMEAIALQVKEAYGIPTNLFIHPSTMAKIKIIKDDVNRPVWKDYITIDGSLKISGMNIIESTAITAGEFLGGDTSVAQLLIREELGIQIGLDGNDFTQNKKTMLAEKRLVQFVSANDTAVLIKGDFATAIGLLTIV